MAVRYRPFYAPRIYDIHRPDNPNIPFFATKLDYEARCIPALPADADPDRCEAWRIEPGIFSLEAYDAILAGPHPPPPRPLGKYICRAGLVQHSRAKIPYVPVSPDLDFRQREERDVCFTLLTREESDRIRKWLWERGICANPARRALTPFGGVRRGGALYNALDPDAKCPPLETVTGPALEALRLGDSGFARSQVPPGVIPVVDDDVMRWYLPGLDGVARDGRATDDGDFTRIEWPVKEEAEEMGWPVKVEAEASEWPVKEEAGETEMGVKVEAEASERPVKNEAEATDIRVKSKAEASECPVKEEAGETEMGVKSEAEASERPLKKKRRRCL